MYRDLKNKINAGRTAQKKLWFRSIDGYKGGGDRILQCNTNGQWVNIQIKDILKILNHLFKNEDKVYPTSEGQKGRWYLFDVIKELADGADVQRLLERYGDKHKDI